MKLFRIILLFTFTSVIGKAQKAVSDPYWEKYRQEGVQSSYVLQAQDQEVKISSYRIDLAKKSRFATLMGNGSANYLVQNPFTLTVQSGSILTNNYPVGSTIIEGPNFQYMANLIINQPLYLGGRIQNTIQLAETSNQGASFSYQVENLSTLYEVDLAYWTAVREVEMTEIVQKYVAVMDSIMQIVEDKVKAQTADSTSYLTTQVKLNEVEFRYLASQNREANALMNLNKVLTVNIDAQTSISKTLPVFDVTDVKILTVDEVLQTAPAIKLVNAQLEASKIEGKLRLAAYRPKVSVSAMANYGMPNWEFQAPGGPIAGSNQAVMAQVNVPIFQWNKKSKDKAITTAQTDAVNFQKKQIENKITYKIQKSIITMNSASERLQLAQKNLADANENLRLSTAQYESGAISLFDLLKVTLYTEDAHINFAQAKYDALMSYATYLMATAQYTP